MKKKHESVLGLELVFAYGTRNNRVLEWSMIGCLKHQTSFIPPTQT